MKLQFELFVCTIRSDESHCVARVETYEDAWTLFQGSLVARPLFSAIAYLELTQRAGVSLIASFQRHGERVNVKALQTRAESLVADASDTPPNPDRFNLEKFRKEYGERVRRIPEEEIPFVDGRVYPAARQSPGMILEEEETMQRLARLGVPSGPDQDTWSVYGDYPMMTTKRYRLIPYERILVEPA